MAQNLLISYDLITPGQKYEKVAEAIQSLGAWARVQKSLWYVHTNYSCEEAAIIVRRAIDANDCLLVAEAGKGCWFNVMDDVNKHLKQYWHH